MLAQLKSLFKFVPLLTQLLTIMKIIEYKNHLITVEKKSTYIKFKVQINDVVPFKMVYIDYKYKDALKLFKIAFNTELTFENYFLNNPKKK